jgi:hypothetical protein
MLPSVPPIALARPPPPTDVVSQGSQELTARPVAHPATNQPGCRRAMAETLAVTFGAPDFQVAFAHARSHHRLR